MPAAESFRDPELARALVGRIRALAGRLGRPTAFMEVCGTHTVAIARSGLEGLLPEGLRLVSGPGCPVCVTPQGEIERAVAAAALPGVALVTFGDMLRVPARGGSLETARSAGGDVRMAYSPREALEMARAEPGRQFIFVGVGFETTIPAFAATVLEARGSGVGNFSVLPGFRLVPPALAAVLASGPALDGFILPGHVSAILGTEPYEVIPASGRAAVVAGFEPLDLLLGVEMLLAQLAEGRPRVEIAYRRAVRPEGNPQARRLTELVFEPADAVWRGIGTLPASGLAFRSEFRDFDAAARFGLPTPEVPEPDGCRCGEVLTGHVTPRDCPLFGNVCTPEDPVGPCMVSSEGCCAARYRYGPEGASAGRSGR
ncbi:MAG TPA: hydrogenase formation protein HypD [Planctomycetota bacterium]|nr:hydrogenase formation protein HypD [Planctomycetota bacterium]